MCVVYYSLVEVPLKILRGRSLFKPGGGKIVYILSGAREAGSPVKPVAAAPTRHVPEPFSLLGKVDYSYIYRSPAVMVRVFPHHSLS